MRVLETMLSDAKLAHIQSLFVRHGERCYDDSRQEPVTALQHALQCAQLAEWAHADDTLVAAALLHDIGHFLAPAERAVAADHHDDQRRRWWISRAACV